MQTDRACPAISGDGLPFVAVNKAKTQPVIWVHWYLGWTYLCYRRQWSGWCSSQTLCLWTLYLQSDSLRTVSPQTLRTSSLYWWIYGDEKLWKLGITQCICCSWCVKGPFKDVLRTVRTWVLWDLLAIDIFSFLMDLVFQGEVNVEVLQSLFMDDLQLNNIGWSEGNCCFNTLDQVSIKALSKYYMQSRTEPDPHTHNLHKVFLSSRWELVCTCSQPLIPA